MNTNTDLIYFSPSQRKIAIVKMTNTLRIPQESLN